MSKTKLLLDLVDCLRNLTGTLEEIGVKNKDNRCAGLDHVHLPSGDFFLYSVVHLHTAGSEPTRFGLQGVNQLFFTSALKKVHAPVIVHPATPDPIDPA